MSFFQSTKFIDESGVPYGVKHVNNKPRVSAVPYLYDVAEGNVAGHSEFEWFGRNPDIDITEEDLWPTGGIYVWPAAAQQMELVSTSAQDSAAGTGIRTLTLYYLKTDGTAATEDLALNGLTAVTTVATDIYRVNALKAKTTGAGMAAAGTITIRNLADTPVYSSIEVGFTRSRNSMYTVPKGKVLYITSMTGGCISGATNEGVITLRATYDHDAGALTSGGFFMPHAEVAVANTSGSIYRPFEIPIKYPAGTDIKLSGSSTANNAQMFSSLRGWLEDA